MPLLPRHYRLRLCRRAPASNPANRRRPTCLLRHIASCSITPTWTRLPLTPSLNSLHCLRHHRRRPHPQPPRITTLVLILPLAWLLLSVQLARLSGRLHLQWREGRLRQHTRTTLPSRLSGLEILALTTLQPMPIYVRFLLVTILNQSISVGRDRVSNSVSYQVLHLWKTWILTVSLINRNKAWMRLKP